MGLFGKKGNRRTIDDEKQKILMTMQPLSGTDPDYAKLGSELKELTQAEATENGWKAQLGGQVLGAFLGSVGSSCVQGLFNRRNVDRVTEYEKEDILKTQAMKFIK